MNFCQMFFSMRYLCLLDFVGTSCVQIVFKKNLLKRRESDLTSPTTPAFGQLPLWHFQTSTNFGQHECVCNVKSCIKWPCLKLILWTRANMFHPHRRPSFQWYFVNRQQSTLDPTMPLCGSPTWHAWPSAALHAWRGTSNQHVRTIRPPPKWQREEPKKGRFWLRALFRRASTVRGVQKSFQNLSPYVAVWFFGESHK